jgi:hypothetical protein
MSAALNRREFFSRLLPASLRERGADTPPTTASLAPPPMTTPAPPSATASTSSSSIEPLRLPPLQQTLLDVATTDALFRDLGACTRIHAVIPKYTDRRHTEAETISLETARTRLAAGLLLGVQIRYGYDDHTWCDTLIRRPNGLTLVRIREADIEATVGPIDSAAT